MPKAKKSRTSKSGQAQSQAVQNEPRGEETPAKEEPPQSVSDGASLHSSEAGPSAHKNIGVGNEQPSGDLPRVPYVTTGADDVGRVLESLIEPGANAEQIRQALLSLPHPPSCEEVQAYLDDLQKMAGERAEFFDKAARMEDAVEEPEIEIPGSSLKGPDREQIRKGMMKGVPKELKGKMRGCDDAWVGPMVNLTSEVSLCLCHFLFFLFFFIFFLTLNMFSSSSSG